MNTRILLPQIFSALAIASLVIHARTADKQIPTLSVAPTKAQEIAYWQPSMGDGLAQMMVTELNNLPNFKVLESLALDDLRSERELGEKGEVAANEAVQKGQWKGADYT